MKTIFVFRLRPLSTVRVLLCETLPVRRQITFVAGLRSRICSTTIRLFLDEDLATTLDACWRAKTGETMKLIRLGEPGRENPGVILEDSARLDVSSFARDFDEALFADSGLSRLRLWLKENATSAPGVAHSVRLGSPIARPSKIVCIGLNFGDHARRKQPGDPERASHIFQGHPLSGRAERWSSTLGDF